MTKPLDEQTSPEVASLAGRTLRDDKASTEEKTLAGSALSQAKQKKSPGEDMREIIDRMKTDDVDDAPGDQASPNADE